MARVTNGGVSIHYEDEGSGAAVVFLQGLGRGRWAWRWQRDAVSDAYRTIVPHNRGTGRSDVPGLPGRVGKLPRRVRAPLILQLLGYSVAEMADDLEAVLADSDVREAHLVGAGLGGMIAQRYALDHSRAASLALLATSPGGPEAAPMPEDTRDRLFDVPNGADERGTVRHRMRPEFTERFTNRNPHLIDRIVEWRLEQDANDPAREAQAAAFFGFDASDELSSVRLPALVLHGDEDRVVPVENARLLHRSLPDSTLEVIEGGSHLFFLEEDDRVTDRLLAFLDERA